MDAAELQSTLKAGIAAVRAGDRAQGRTLLMRVVEADQDIEPAWLWLSAAVDDPADQLVALENVLALNPRHAQALAGAEALRAKLGLVAPSPALPMPARVEPAARPEPGSLFSPPEPAERPALPLLYPDLAANTEDDPYQCAFCGHLAEPEDTRCPRCRRGLLVASQSWRGGSLLYGVLLLAGLTAQAAVLQAAGVYGNEAFPTFASMLPFREIWTANVVGPAIARAVLWAVLVLVVIAEGPHTFRIVLALACADLAWLAVGYQLGVLGPLLAVANAALSGLTCILALAAVISQTQARVRLKVVLDKNLHTAVLFERHAESYASEGKWALAALHWRRAIGLFPRAPRYYKGLGQANLRLERREAALQAWASGAELSPDDPEFRRLIDHHKA